MVANKSESGSNATSPAVTNIPETLLETFLPGYSLFAGYVQQAIGFDVSILVSFIALVLALTTGFQYLGRKFGGAFSDYFTSTITIDSEDEIYYYITSWITEVDTLQRARNLQAVSDSSGVDSLLGEDDRLAADEEELFNFSSWESRIPPKYMPAVGAHWFWYKGSLFKFERRRDSAMKDGWFGDKVLGSEKSINLTVLGRSTKPAKELLLEARDRSLSKESSKTIVRRPSPKENRGRGRQAWMRVAMRPSRPMETVVLDSTQKSLILRDINEFVHPATVQWYANRGIPYRRGYLFHGPPGTGKTSLSFAIAGVFGFDVYCISLLEPTLTEEDLSILFNNLPSRCVVLLEDIDAAGLHRKKGEVEEDDKKKKNSDKDEKEDNSSMIAKEVAKAFKDVSEQATRNRNGRGSANDQQGISLSGLLNAIDGVASPEGRILVMTTNFPEKLDEALVRPGRIDMKIEFTLATKVQIRELFLRMYISDKIISKRKKPTKVSEIVAPAAYETEILNGHPKASDHPHLADSSKSSPLQSTPSNSTTKAHQPKPLSELAEDFSAQLPESTFSPAEIQGFLLTRKKDPERAVNEVGRWRNETLESKKRGTTKTLGTELEAAATARAEESEKQDKELPKNMRHAAKAEENKQQPTANGERTVKTAADTERKAGEQSRGERSETVTSAATNGGAQQNGIAGVKQNEKTPPKIDGEESNKDAVEESEGKETEKDKQITSNSTTANGKDDEEGSGSGDADEPEGYELDDDLHDGDDPALASPTRSEPDGDGVISCPDD